MPAFEYEALDGAGKKARGYLTADSEVAARRELRRRQLAPLKVARAAGDATALVEALRQATGAGVLVTHGEIVDEMTPEQVNQGGMSILNKYLG